MVGEFHADESYHGTIRPFKKLSSKLGVEFEEKLDALLPSLKLSETNMAPENTPLEKEVPIGKPSIFRCYVSFREGIQDFRDP